MDKYVMKSLDSIADIIGKDGNYVCFQDYENYGVLIILNGIKVLNLSYKQYKRYMPKSIVRLAYKKYNKMMKKLNIKI